MRGGVFSAVLAAAAMSAIGSSATPAIVPEPSHKRHLIKVPSRGDKKKAKRREYHASRIGSPLRRGNKLGRRLRRNHELGRAGAF